jgi:hypothetical protein
MMAIGDVLREMLVKVRYDYDDTSEQRMRAGLRRSVVEANLLTDAIKAFVRTTLDAFPKLITGFSNLHYTMNRTGSSVSGLKALQYAAVQTGASVEEASAAVEALGKSMRTLPGMKSYWESQIPALKGVEDNAKRIVEIGKFLKGLNNRPLAEAYNKELLHWSDNFLQGAMSGDFEKSYQERLEVLRKFGLNEEEAANMAKEMTHNWQRFLLVATTGFEKLALDLFPFLNKQMERFTQYVIDHEADLVRWIGDLEEGLVKAGHFIRDDVYPSIVTMASYVRDVLVPTLTTVRDLFGGWGEAFDAAWKLMFPKLALIKGFFDTYQIFKGLPDGPAQPVPQGKSDWGETLVKIAENTDLMATILKSIENLFRFMKHPLDYLSESFGKVKQSLMDGLGFGSPNPNGSASVGGGGGAGGAEGTGGVLQQGGRGKYNPAAAAALIRKVGGTEEEARILGAISQPESGGNPNAHNPNAATGDNSYGLWQINMLGAMGPERRAKFGLRSNEELFNPETNARVALQMYREAHGARDWSTYKAGSHRAYLDAASRGARSSNPEEFMGGAAAKAPFERGPRQTNEAAVPTPPRRPDRERHSARDLPRQYAFLSQPLQDGNKSWVHNANVSLHSSNTFNIQGADATTGMKVAAAVSRQNERDMAAARRSVSTDWVHNTIMRA